MEIKKVMIKTKTIDGKELALSLIQPSQKIMNEADRLYRLEFGKMVRDKALVNAEVAKIVEEREIFKDAFEEEYAGLLVKTIELERKLEDDKEEVQKKLHALELKTVREKMFDMNSQIQGIYRNTAEHLAEEIKMHFLTVHCVVNPATAEKFFADLDDFYARDDEPAVADALFAVYKFFYDLPNDLDSKYPENVYLQEQGVLDKEYKFIDKTEEKAEEKTEAKPEKNKKKKKEKKVKVEA